MDEFGRTRGLPCVQFPGLDRRPMTTLTDPGRKFVLAVKDAIEKELKKRLALVETTTATPREPGIPVTLRDVGAWLRAIDGVKRVIELQLRGANGQKIDGAVVVPRNGLPRCLFSRNSIEVKRPEPGRSR